MPRPISATIHIASLRHNLDMVIQSLNNATAPSGVKRPHIWAVMKANAYGHDIENAVRAFSAAEGMAMLDLKEAIRCRAAGWTGPIMLLEGFFQPEDLDVLAEFGLTTVIHCHEQLKMLEQWKGGAALNAMVKLNSGMNRLGFSVDDYPAAFERAQRLQKAGKLGSVGRMTHFARADDNIDATLEQIRCFNRITDGLPGPVSVCNSAATLSPDLGVYMPSGPDHWVRPGICLYGSSPFASISAEDFGLQPGMTLAAEIISVRGVKQGEGIGYGHTYVAEQAMRIGVVACGYADGYPRHAGTGTPVTVNGVRTCLLGRVSMDMLAVDLTPVPAAGVGSQAVLFGQGGPSVDEVAAAAGTLGYELICAVAPRVPRVVQN